MADIARSIGFKDISFQFEPIAAAYDYEQQVTNEELALIIDIGGGTSDFTLIKLSKENRAKSDRQSDIIANHGIHIGGTDFDRHLSLATVMPYFGLGLPYKEKPTLDMPKHYYVDLATWHCIHLLYEPAVHRDLADLRLMMSEREPIERLIKLLKQKDGHRLAGQMEQAKIDLSFNESSVIDLSFLTRDDLKVEEIDVAVNRQTLSEAIANDVGSVFSAIDETLNQAGIKASQIDTVFTTGGSTALSLVKETISQRFAESNWVSGDLFNSVGKGLVLEAKRRYL